MKHPNPRAELARKRAAYKHWLNKQGLHTGNAVPIESGRSKIQFLGVTGGSGCMKQNMVFRMLVNHVLKTKRVRFGKGIHRQKRIPIFFRFSEISLWQTLCHVLESFDLPRSPVDITDAKYLAERWFEKRGFVFRNAYSDKEIHLNGLFVYVNDMTLMSDADFRSMKRPVRTPGGISIFILHFPSVEFISGASKIVFQTDALLYNFREKAQVVNLLNQEEEQIVVKVSLIRNKFGGLWEGMSINQFFSNLI